MNSLSDAPAGSHRGPGRGVAILLALSLSGVAAALVLVLLTLAGGAETSPGAIVLTAVLSVILLLGVGALGWHAGVRLTRQQLGEALREARLQAHVLGQLQPDWQWATDAGHHLVRWQAPQGVPASSWVGVAATQVLWDRFEGIEESTGADLRDRLEARQSFAEARVRPRDGTGSEWALRAIACFDGAGRFSGYQGTACRVALAELAEPVAPEPPKPADGEDHAAFSYTISHDLRAPLRIVDGFARILKEDYGRVLDRMGNEHIDRVVGAAGRMQGMIDALLSLAQLSTQPLAHQPVNMSHLAELVLEDLRRGSPERIVDVHIQAPLTVQGDPILLRMLLENLLGNAWKYSGKCVQAQIRFDVRQAEGRTVYCIGDNGAGFDMRFADRLFGAFQRLHSASDFQGTGVGLASVRRIVRRHGGEIWAEAEVGQGARFYFTLPG